MRLTERVLTALFAVCDEPSVRIYQSWTGGGVRKDPTAEPRGKTAVRTKVFFKAETKYVQG